VIFFNFNQIMKKYLFLLLTLMLAGVTAHSQLTVKGEYRSRAEMRSGYARLNADSLKPAYFVNQRARIGLYYQKDWLKTGFSFQDVRFWGSDNIFDATGIYGDDANFDLNEAWVELSFAGHSAVKVGRQIFDYDDGRLLSRRNWNNYGISYDALLYKYNQNKWIIDLAFSYNTEFCNTFFNPYPDNKMRTLNFLRVERIINETWRASAIAMGTGFTKNNNSETIYLKGSYGGLLKYSNNGLLSWVTLYYQNGKHHDGREVSAWNLNFKSDYRIGDLTLGFGLTLISGDENPDDEKINEFDLLYGTRHSVYGHMDYFNKLPVATDHAGLNNLFLTSAYQINEKTSLLADYHLFSLNQPLMNENDELDKYLGSELDLGISVNFSPDVNLRGGYSFMLPGASLEIIQGIGEGKSKFSSWAFLMLTVKPVLYKSR